MSERWGRGGVRRRSVLGVSLCALLAGCGSGRTSGEEGMSGECVPASEAMSSPSVSPSRKSGTTVDIAYFPEDYIVGEGLAVSPDGALVAASQSRARSVLGLDSTFGTVIWDASTGKVVRRLDNRRDGVLAWHPGGEWLAVGDAFNAAIQVTDREGNLLWELRGHERIDELGSPIVDLAFSKDGELLASASRDGTVRLWGMRKDQCRPVRVLTISEPRRLSFSPDSDRLAVAAEDGCSIWNVRSGEREKLLHEVPHPVKGVAYGPDGVLVAITSDPGASYLIRGEQVEAGPEPPTSSPSHVAVSKDGRIAISASSDPQVMLWDPATQVSSLAPEPPKTVGRMEWSPDGQKLYAASQKHGALCWSADGLRHFDLP